MASNNSPKFAANAYGFDKETLHFIREPIYTLPMEVKTWMIKMDEYLMKNGCKVKYIADGKGNYVISYFAKNTKLKVCRFLIQITNATIEMCGTHFVTEDNIVDQLPEEMYRPIRNNKACQQLTGCCDCVKYFKPKRGGKEHLTCGKGFTYPLNESTNFEILEKWLRLENEWCNNPLSLGSVIKTTIQKFKMPEKSGGELSVFEQTNKVQRLIKPPIDDACEYILTDIDIKETVTKFITFLRDLGLKPKWKSKNRYDFRHNASDFVFIRFEGENVYFIGLDCFGWRVCVEDFRKYVPTLAENVQEKLFSLNHFRCTQCRIPCESISVFELAGERHVICPHGNTFGALGGINLTAEQLEDIKWLVKIGMDFIDFKRSK